MLESVQLKGIGPAPEMFVSFAPRLNLITGDNGLGKSFLLEIAWWVLSRTWSGEPARPNPRSKNPSISFELQSKTKRVSYKSEFDRQSQAWSGKRGRPPNPGLVVYAQVDGGFSVWDPARNYWRSEEGLDVQERPAAYLFKPTDVWNGLRQDQQFLCNGLINDWAAWQKENGEPFRQLCRALEKLSPDPNEVLRPGKLTRISLDDVRDMPTITMPFDEDVPIAHVSAGMKRIIALAYLLVWSWQEHIRASQLLDQPTTRQIIFLIDEIESHLHPRWQRHVFDALLAVINEKVTLHLASIVKYVRRFAVAFRESGEINGWPIPHGSKPEGGKGSSAFKSAKTAHIRLQENMPREFESKVPELRRLRAIVDELNQPVNTPWSSAQLGNPSKQQKTRPYQLITDELEEIAARLEGLHVEPLFESAQVQIIAVTHSPLILTSLEPIFDDKQDKLFDLALVPQESGHSQVELHEVQWRKHGEASNWLTSDDVFGLKSERSLPAEQLIERASALMSDEKPDRQELLAMHKQLQKMLGDTDPFWVRWRYVGEKQGWLK